MAILETMSEFFAARVDGYDEHMINNVEGCKEGYEKMAELIPDSTETLLDLGCGTGLELDRIFRRFPSLSVTGIDLCPEMLSALQKKHSDKNLNLHCADYFTHPFGENTYDCAVSFESLHHFTREKKLGLYQKIFRALKDDGIYVECDYMVETQEEEDFFFAENNRLRTAQNIPENVFCHYDTPCTVQNQISLLTEVGFSKIEKIFRIGGTVLLTAKKG